jgi:hypothetical protein
MNISDARLSNQKLIQNKSTSVQELAKWMGAIQAQDFSMSKWAIGIRCKNLKENDVDDAINSGSVIRTHILRPTWHIVSSDDIYWMLDLSARRIKSSLTSRHEQLELEKKSLSRCYSIISKALSGTYLAREEIALLLNDAGIRTDENRLSHILFCAELEQLVCSGPVIKGRQSYSLLSERVTAKKSLSPDEALAELAYRYFTGHGPATTDDFRWWSNLTAGMVKKAVEMNKHRLTTEKTAEKEFIYNEKTEIVRSTENTVLLLPAFDEFLIAYTDRSASVDAKHIKRTISFNGIFYPVVVIDGLVAGIWKRTTKNDRVIIVIKLFGKQKSEIKSQIVSAAEDYAGFINRKPEISFEKY